MPSGVREADPPGRRGTVRSDMVDRARASMSRPCARGRAEAGPSRRDERRRRADRRTAGHGSRSIALLMAALAAAGRARHRRARVLVSRMPSTVPFRGWRRYDDDLRFAHVLADAADDITTRRFRALDLRVETKPDLTPGDRRRPRHRGVAAQRAAPGAAAGCGARRGVRPDGQRAALLGHRPDRRHQELRPRRPGLGDAHRPDRRRRGGGGRGVRPGARPALVGGGGRRGVDRAQPDQGHPLPGVRGHQAQRRVVLLLEPRRLGGPRAGSTGSSR